MLPKGKIYLIIFIIFSLWMMVLMMIYGHMMTTCIHYFDTYIIYRLDDFTMVLGDTPSSVLVFM